MPAEQNKSTLWSRIKNRSNKLMKVFNNLSPDERGGKNGFGKWLDSHPKTNKVLGSLIGNRTVENFSTNGKSEKIKGIGKTLLKAAAMTFAGVLIGMLAPLLPGILTAVAVIGAVVGTGILMNKKIKGIGYSAEDRKNQLEHSLKEKVRESKLAPMKEKLKEHEASKSKERKKGAFIGVGVGLALLILTGGTALPLIALLCCGGAGAGVIATDIKRAVKQHKIKKEMKEILKKPLTDEEKPQILNDESLSKEVAKAKKHGLLEDDIEKKPFVQKDEYKEKLKDILNSEVKGINEKVNKVNVGESEKQRSQSFIIKDKGSRTL